MKPRLISGIQPTGKLHLGNYLGALKHFVDLQNSGKYECFFFIADLHSLTEGPNPSTLDTALSFLAAGLDPKKSTIFVQSQVPAHPELGWILETIAPLGEMERMTQFKDKSARSPQNINLGLLSYPALMAADILLYDARFVPVGEDQLQHLELTRTLARRFNGRFGKTFIEPRPLLTQAPRLMSLDDPTKKMSKSLPGGCLFLDDSPKVMREKFARATTDSGKEIKYDSEHKPGISNLILIYATLTGMTIKAVESLFTDKGYADFKKELSEIVVEALEPFQKRKKELAKDIGLIHKTGVAGSKKAGAIAAKKLLEVKKKIGLML